MLNGGVGVGLRSEGKGEGESEVERVVSLRQYYKHQTCVRRRMDSNLLVKLEAGRLWQWCGLRMRQGIYSILFFIFFNCKNNFLLFFK